MGQRWNRTEPTSVSDAVAELRAAHELYVAAECVLDEMTKRAARAAQAEGLTVRQFAAEAGISKSAAGRHARDA